MTDTDTLPALEIALRSLVALINDRKAERGMRTCFSDQSKKQQAAEKAAVNKVFQETHGRKATTEEITNILGD